MPVDEPENLNPAEPELPHRVPDQPATRRRWPLVLGSTVLLLVLIAVGGFFYARHWMRSALRENLPLVDGRAAVSGLSAPVTVARDAQGVPHIAASSLEDLLFAQGYITASDRLWQMDTLRRLAAGDLAEVLGSKLIEHDTIQRTLQVRAAADRAATALPPDQMHWLEAYARGVNASILAQQAHLPLEFRLLRYTPKPWVPRDSLLIGLVMYEDLTTAFPHKLGREALSARLAPQLIADLYPTGSWRDHPVAQPPLDLTAPQPEIPDIPLDESQSALRRPLRSPEHIQDLLQLDRQLAEVSARFGCDACISGSNGWAVAGSKTRSGKPMLSSDMHLTHSVPEIYYMNDLHSGSFHVSGVSIPGLPFVLVGHNQHVAWGFTNLGADVQDLYIEQTRGSGPQQEFQAADGIWQPMLHRAETIHVKGAADVVLDVTETVHGGMAMPVISGLYPHEKRSIALRWTIYDPANVTVPLYAIDAATDWPSFCAAFSTFGGPAQNVQYADDQGHIGYHAIGKIPVRGSMAAPAALSPVPIDGRDATHDWAGYIPFDQMPQSLDPPAGLVATANSRVVPEGYPFPITLDWAAPYRNERIWKVLGAKSGLVPSDLLKLQIDVYSDLDRVVAQRLVYAIDHTAIDHTATGDSSRGKRLRQAADLMRAWDGTVAIDSSAAAIVDAAREAFWPLILAPQLGEPEPSGKAATPDDPINLYLWDEKSYAEEQIIVNGPPQWLPVKYPDWNALLTASVEKGLADAKAPADLSKWQYGAVHPAEIMHPIFTQAPLLGVVLAMHTGTGIVPQSGDGSTVKQVARSFGPSERLTVDFGDLDESTLNLVLGESENLASPWFLDQWPAWYLGNTFPMPFSDAATKAATQHTLTLVPQP